jgi:hypothetical protein
MQPFIGKRTLLCGGNRSASICSAVSETSLSNSSRCSLVIEAFRYWRCEAVHCDKEQDRTPYFSGSIMIRRTFLFWA